MLGTSMKVTAACLNGMTVHACEHPVYVVHMLERVSVRDQTRGQGRVLLRVIAGDQLEAALGWRVHAALDNAWIDTDPARGAGFTHQRQEVALRAADIDDRLTL